MIEKAINTAIGGLKKIRLDHDHITSFPKGIWALDKEGNILHDLTDKDLNKWHMLISKDESAYKSFYESNCYDLLYPLPNSNGWIAPISLDPDLKSGIYVLIFNEEWASYELMDITDAIRALKIAKLI